jgi:hypothetical protein
MVGRVRPGTYLMDTICRLRGSGSVHLAKKPRGLCKADGPIVPIVKENSFALAKIQADDGGSEESVDVSCRCTHCPTFLGFRSGITVAKRADQRPGFLI